MPITTQSLGVGFDSVAISVMTSPPFVSSYYYCHASKLSQFPVLPDSFGKIKNYEKELK